MLTGLYEHANNVAIEKSKEAAADTYKTELAVSIIESETKAKQIKLGHQNQDTQAASYVQQNTRRKGAVRSFQRIFVHWQEASTGRVFAAMRVNYERELCDVGAKECYRKLMEQWANSLLRVLRHIQMRAMHLAVNNWRFGRRLEKIMSLQSASDELHDANRNAMRSFMAE